MTEGFDTSQIDDHARRLLRTAQNTMPNETKKFMNKQGGKLKALTFSIAKSNVRKKTGNYHESIKKGKVYTRDGVLCIRVYSSEPHAHLIEYGHRKVTKNGQEVGFVQGKGIFQKSHREYGPKFIQSVNELIDDLLKKGLC